MIPATTTRRFAPVSAGNTFSARQARRRFVARRMRPARWANGLFLPFIQLYQLAREIPINEQIATVKRRLLQIENKYPRLVREHVITQERADNEIERFRAVLETLIKVKAHADASADPPGTFTPPAPYSTETGAGPIGARRLNIELKA